MHAELITCSEIKDSQYFQELLEAAEAEIILSQGPNFHTRLATLAGEGYLTNVRFNGTFGVLMFHNQTGENVAISGFDLVKTETGVGALSNHLPQGGNKGSMSRNVRRELLKFPEFRDQIFADMVHVTKEFGIEPFIVTSAINHYKVASEQLPYSKAVEIIDEVALRQGFQYNQEGNLILY